MMLQCAALVATLAGASGAVQAPASPYTMARTEVLTLRASDDAAYRIFVSLPAAYEGSAQRFPIVYVLDGDWYFSLAASTARLLEVTREMPPVIVAAIGYGGAVAGQRVRRNREFTPDPVAGLDGSGHAERFLASLRRDLLPAIESRYRTNGERVLVGHSLGGLFAAFAAGRDPGLFQRIVIGSPALRGSAASVIDTLAASKISPTAVYLGIAAGEVPPIREGYQALHAWLKGTRPTVRWIAEEFAGMTHQSVIGALFARAFPWIFSGA